MNSLNKISNSLNTLVALSTKETIYLDDVPAAFGQDLQTFIMGKTLTMKEGCPTIGHNLYKKWLKKLQTHGFDYEIDFKLI